MQDDSSSDGGSKPGNAAEDLSLGAEVGDLLRQYQQSEAATREKVTRDKALEMPKDGDTAHNKEDATDNRPEESSKPEHEASDSTPGPSKPTAAGLKTEEEIVSVSEEELLSESRQNLADTIFVVGASEGESILNLISLSLLYDVYVLCTYQHMPCVSNWDKYLYVSDCRMLMAPDT